MFGEVNGTGSLFLCYALINHSCCPNVFMDLTYGQETTGELRALRDMSTTVPVNEDCNKSLLLWQQVLKKLCEYFRDIKRGDEINNTYITLGYLNKKLRQKELRNLFEKTWDFFQQSILLNVSVYFHQFHSVSGGLCVTVPPAAQGRMMTCWPPRPGWRRTSGAWWPAPGTTRTGPG